MRSGEYLLVQALSLYTGDDDFSGFVRVRFLAVPCNPSRVADWLHTGHCEVSSVISLYPVIPSILSSISSPVSSGSLMMQGRVGLFG